MRFLIVAFALLFSNFALASGDCKINAKAVVGVLDFEITGCKIDGTLVNAGGHLSGMFTVELAALDAGLELRTKHMHEKYLQTEHYAIASANLEPVKIGADSFKADLTVHGMTKKISGKVLESSATNLKLEFKMNITDFGMEKPGYKGVVIGENLHIFVNIDK